MKRKSYTGYIIGGILLVLVVFCIIVFNRLVTKEEKVKLQWNEVQNNYQRRLDLIPSLVKTVEGGAAYEQGTLTRIAEARAKAIAVGSSTEATAGNVNRANQAQDELAGAANRLLISVEKYPQIQGTKAFSGLQSQLEGTERRIKVARKDFNAAIAEYNSSVKSFPTNIIAPVLGFKSKEGFQSDTGAAQAIEIKF